MDVPSSGTSSRVSKWTLPEQFLGRCKKLCVKERVILDFLPSSWDLFRKPGWFYLPQSMKNSNISLIAFIAKYMEKKKKWVRKYAASTSQAHPPPPEPPTIPPQVLSADAFDFSIFAQWQYQCNTYTWDQNEALNRSNTAVHRSVYNAQMHPGDANFPLMTPEEFQAYVAWPEVRPNAFGGGGYYAGNEEESADDDGDNDGDDDGGNQDDPDRVPSANTTGSDDDFYRDNMQE